MSDRLALKRFSGRGDQGCALQTAPPAPCFAGNVYRHSWFKLKRVRGVTQRSVLHASQVATRLLVSSTGGGLFAGEPQTFAGRKSGSDEQVGQRECDPRPEDRQRGDFPDQPPVKRMSGDHAACCRSTDVRRSDRDRPAVERMHGSPEALPAPTDTDGRDGKADPGKWTAMRKRPMEDVGEFDREEAQEVRRHPDRSISASSVRRNERNPRSPSPTVRAVAQFRADSRVQT